MGSVTDISTARKETIIFADLCIDVVTTLDALGKDDDFILSVLACIRDVQIAKNRFSE